MLPNLTKSRLWHVKTCQKCDQTIPLPKLTQANLEQVRSRLNIFKISSQAHTISFHVFSTFLGSKNVTQGKASSPWSRFCHLLAWPKCDSNVTSPQAPQALPSFKQGHVWTKFQTWPK
ncbi:hypothetical protein PIB30_102994, partial [Stylosanthes scabra]|nr:hypothetical protein [Stylosanthes scabra]